MGNVPAGWYSDPGGSGGSRWWNGREWTSAVSGAGAPSQPAAPAGAPKSKGGLGCLGWVAVIVGVLVLGVTIPAIVASVAGGSSSTSTPVSPHAPAAPAEPQKTQAQLQDEAQQAQGWTVIESGSLYGKFAEKGTYSCGHYGCSNYLVASIYGCPTALYVEANVESNGTVVGTTNELLGGLQPNQIASVMLEDYRDVGDSFRISEVNCY